MEERSTFSRAVVKAVGGGVPQRTPWNNSAAGVVLELLRIL